MGLKRQAVQLESIRMVFAPYMGLKRKILLFTLRDTKFAPYMGLKSNQDDLHRS